MLLLVKHQEENVETEREEGSQETDNSNPLNVGIMTGEGRDCRV